MGAPSSSFLPDWDDDEPTLAPPGWAAPDESGPRPSVRPPAASIVRLRVPVADEETRDLLRDLGERQVALTGGLAWTYARLSVLPRDPSTRAAGLTLSARLADLGDVRDALNELYCAIARRPEDGLLTAGSALALYLDGVYRWLLGALEALAVVGNELLDLQADWSSFRARLDDATSFYPAALAPAVRSALWAVRTEDARLDLTAAFDELTFALRMFEANLDHRFG